MKSHSRINLTSVGYEVLRALSEYRYLTTKQILALGIVKDRGHLGHVLSSLLSAKRRDEAGERKPKEIGEIDFGVKVGKGRLPRMYYLTKQGAELLEFIDPELAPVSYPNRVVRFAPDYEHRVSCVDFRIALNAWATDNGNTVSRYCQYFDWSPATREARPQPSTRLALSHKRIDPDALFYLRDAKGIERSYVFEMVNGRDTGRVIDKIQHIARGLSDRSLNRAMSFPLDEAVRILFEFEHRRTAELVASRAVKAPLVRKYGPHFLFKARDDICRETLHTDWMSLDPQHSNCQLF